MEKDLAGQRREGFEHSDVFYFSKKGIEAIVEDEVTQRFCSTMPASWNLFTRTNINYQYLNLKLTFVWFIGILFRYLLLFPLRVVLFAAVVIVLAVGTIAIAQLPKSRIKFRLGRWLQQFSVRMGMKVMNYVVQYHNQENKPLNGGICVANHTTPLDILPLMYHVHYCVVGQVHTGCIGFFENLGLKTSEHIAFERSEVKDRHALRKRLTEHIKNKINLPVLIFPEGTCINNTSVMMFQKGAFEIGATIYPVAMKYDQLFSDPYWDSTKYSMWRYALRLLGSWSLVCDVWYLPPMNKKEDEDAVQFASRVQSKIAAQAGLTLLPWDGGLKRKKVKDSLKMQQQKEYSRIMEGKGPCLNCKETPACQNGP